MASMMINSSVERAVLVMVNQEQERIVKVLAEKYGFDEDEAMECLEAVRVEKKEVTPRKPKEDKPVKAKPEPKGKGKAKAKDEEPAEKKPRKPSGYQAYMKAMRPETKEELAAMDMEELQAELGLEEEPEKFHPKHVMTCLGQRWKALSDEERAEWVEKATSGEESDA